jgi:hypothetical protein
MDVHLVVARVYDVQIYQTGNVLVSGKVSKKGDLSKGTTSKDGLVEDAVGRAESIVSSSASLFITRSRRKKERLTE